MCQKLIEKYSCGDDESSTFPCEDFFTNGECDNLEDKVVDHKGKKCPECRHLDDALKRIAEDASLAPEPKRGGAEVDPNRPKQYFKEYIKWSKCGHLSHPKWTDIERFDDGPEVGFEIEGVGRCHGCAEADPQTLRRMEKNGELEKPDPWGFMEVIEVAAGSSDTGEQMSNEAIALGITDTALADMREGNRNVGSATDGLPGYKTSIGGKVAAAAAVRAGRRAIDDDDVSRSPSPEIDTGVGKNKGRRGHENDSYASRYGSHEDDDDDDDEAAHSDNSDSVYSDDENVISPVIPRSRAAAAAASTTARPFRRPRFDDDDSDSEAESPTSAASPSRAPQTQGSSSHSPAADANTVEISARERQRLGIPANMNLTRASLARFEQRKRDEGRLAMRQNASGDIDEE